MGKGRARIAYLITAHNEPGHLARMVNALNCPGSAFFIHIDKKSNAAPFEELIRSKRNVHFVSNRIDANWMGFSLVAVSLRLLALAVLNGFDYCLLLSGSDYPVKSNECLLSFFGKARKEYIGFWKLEDRPSWLPKIRYYYPIDAIPIRGWSTNTEKVHWRRYFWGRYFKYQKYIPHREFLTGMVPFGGPDWWSLSYDCAKYVLKYVEENPSYTKFYKYTQSPGELFFQTIILNSDFADRIENYESYQKWSMERSSEPDLYGPKMLPEDSFNYRYIDWSGELTGQRETPAILDERDWGEIKSTHCHFARKFDPKRSATLLDRIDREILGLSS